ncbi:MAG: hypothetical protein V4492_01970 [Chlamydiota bacterium]
MVRISKQNRRRNVSPRRPARPGIKTGAKKDALPEGFKVHPNAIEGNLAQNLFIPKIK